LEQTGIADAINDGGGRWESAQNKMLALDFATQAQQMKAIGGQARLCAGQRARHHPGRHAGDRVGIGQPAGLLCVGRGQGDLRGRRAEAGSDVGRGARADPYPQPAGRRPRAGRLRAAQPGGKISEIHTELPGRIHVVLIRQQVGYDPPSQLIGPQASGGVL
jgi:hypothetical protein